MRYSIWNNKGGVGKSFLTFCFATEYALKHQDELVVVADLCPQANVSEMLLGGNGVGEDNLAKLCEEGLTIAGYIKDRFLRNRYEKLGSELRYFADVNRYNNAIPSNLFLLPGDTDLDLASQLVSFIAAEKAVIKEAEIRAMSILSDILSAFEEAYRDKKITIFIDCNPSFALYTELAIFASERLIIPCTGDFASLRGIDNVMKLLYNVGKSEKQSIFSMIDFDEKARRLKMNLPVLHLGVINKSRSIDQGATTAYRAHVEEIRKRFSDLNALVPVKVVKDCNNISLVVNYTGMPVSKLRHQKYQVYNEDSQVNQSQLEPICADIDIVVDKLEW
jgi:cellulose biosynthesis protein BcsQ